MRLILLSNFILIISSCQTKSSGEMPVETTATEISNAADTIPAKRPKPVMLPPVSNVINTGFTRPDEILTFAKTLVGTPYKYASADPAVGFDCSGFITYVFNHFNIAVPRSSVDFTNVNKSVPLVNAKPGDLLLFTGTDSTSRIVGHMGILTSFENGEYKFIHSTSGKAMGVTISALNKYYTLRFVKVIRVFPENDD